MLTQTSPRNNQWLEEKLTNLWQEYFSDIQKENDIKIQFERNSKTRLGSIALRKKNQEKRRLLKRETKYLQKDNTISIITINGYFMDENIPEEVVKGIIAHEFCHYVHGFNSLCTKKFCKPHQGGIIDYELKNRGFGEILKFQKKWVKDNWRNYVLGNKKTGGLAPGMRIWKLF